MKDDYMCFVDQETVDEGLLKYSAGHVCKDWNGGRICYVVSSEQCGARMTFSIGQPVFNKGGKLLGYLGIGLFDALNYTTTTDGLNIPVEHWEIGLPTRECQNGVVIYTYWQNRARKEQENDD